MERALALLSPADSIRRWLLLRAGRAFGPYIVDRDRRVALGFSISIVVAFLVAVSAPLYLIALGPLVLGVPHLVSDVRYLVARPGFDQRLPILALVGVPLVVLGVTTDPRAGFLAVVGAAIAATRGTALRRAAVALVGLGLIAIASAWPRATMLAFAHLHNLVALVFFWWLRPRRRGLAWLPLAIFGVAIAGLGLGLHEHVAEPLGTISGRVFGTTFDREVMVLADPLPYPWDGRLLVVFAFAQSVHYAIWLRVLPDEARASKTPRSFVQSARALVADLGGLIVIVAMLGAALFLFWGFVDVYHARVRYLAFALFHGYLELAALGLFFAERGTVLAAPGASEVIAAE